MKRRRYLGAIGATVSIASIAGFGTRTGAAQPDTTGGQTGTGGSPTGTTTAGDGGATGTGQVQNRIAMLTSGSDYLFDPVGLSVAPGETVTWVNESGAHSSTAYTTDNPQSGVRRIPEGAEGWNSETLTQQGAEFTHTFEVEGTYDYYCIPHKALGMVGRIVVGEPSGVQDDPPDGPVPSEQAIVSQGAVTQDEFDP